MCWSIISEALTDPEITSSLLLGKLEDQSGEMWQQCNNYFSALVNALFPADPKHFSYEASQAKFIKELLTCTQMRYNDVCNMTIVCFLIH
jgi:hypothetical protein